MRKNALIKSPYIILGFVAITGIFSGCYTVLKSSGEYYSEFEESSSKRSQETYNNNDSMTDTSETEQTVTDSDDQTGTVIINRYYYDSPWWAGYGYAYPGRYWAVSIGYTWYPYGYYPYDYYYWGGCYYPVYPGYYPYFPDPWYYPGTPGSVYTSRRNYGLRHEAVNAFNPNFNRVTPTTALSQRLYNSGTNTGKATAQNKSAVKETKKSRRRFNNQSRVTHSKPVEKTSKDGNTGKREYKEVDLPKNNNRSIDRGFEIAKSRFTRNDQSARSYNNNNNASGGSSSDRSSGARSGSPTINRTYNSKK